MIKNSLRLCLGTTALLALLLVSCSKDNSETIYTPSLSLDPTAIIATVDGGSYNFSYKVSNPADDGQIALAASADWIGSLKDGGSGISFVLEANSGDQRTGKISVTYSSSYGTITQYATILQDGVTAPVLTVQPVAVTASVNGGVYSFSYTVEHPAADGEIGCTATEDWISGFSYSKKGTVVFNVAPNTTEEMRKADISVVYSSSSFGYIEQTVSVVQDHTSGSDGGGDTPKVSMAGTYTASGKAYFDSKVVADSTWTMKIYEGSSDYIIDGLVPASVGKYPGSEAYIAKGSVNSSGKFVIPSQLTGYVNTSSGNFIGWTPCTKYTEEDGWFYSKQGPDCVFTYDEATDSWTSDYGMFLALFSDQTDPWNHFEGFFDVVNPGINIKKISESTSSMTSPGIVAHPIDENLRLHRDFVFVE